MLRPATFAVAKSGSLRRRREPGSRHAIPVPIKKDVERSRQRLADAPVDVISPELVLIDPELAARARVALPPPGWLGAAPAEAQEPTYLSAQPSESAAGADDAERWAHSAARSFRRAVAVGTMAIASLSLAHVFTDADGPAPPKRISSDAQLEASSGLAQLPGCVPANRR